MKYEVFSGKGVTLEKAINQLEGIIRDGIQFGWKPLGGVSVAVYNEDMFAVCQAMIQE